MARSIDECPASGCGMLVRGVKNGVMDGSHYRCTRGHTLVAQIIAGASCLVQDRRDLEDAAEKIKAMPKKPAKKARPSK